LASASRAPSAAIVEEYCISEGWIRVALARRSTAMAAR
jgi:hypothetical protein